MRTTEQINLFWERARERSVHGRVLRRRGAALGAIAIVFCGFLLAIGLSVVVLVFLAGIVGSVGLVALVVAWPRLRHTRGTWLARIRDRARRVRNLVGPHLRHARGSTVTAIAAARETAIRFMPRPARVEPHREALRLNTLGAQHRRDGRYDEAVECHREALEILRALDDRRAVALTQSNLALALSHSGDDEWAIGLFEEAAATLRELGDEEHEAQIMANLGLAHRRHGRREEGDNVLELALAKLNPTSTAYHAIEAQLGRAS